MSWRPSPLSRASGTSPAPAHGAERTDIMSYQVVAITRSCFGGKLVCTDPLSQDNFWHRHHVSTQANDKMKGPSFAMSASEEEDGPNSTPNQLLIFPGFSWNRFAIVLDTWSDPTSAHVYLSKTDLALGSGVGLFNKIKQSGCNGWDYSLESFHCDSDFLSQWVGGRPVVRQGALGQEEH